MRKVELLPKAGIVRLATALGTASVSSPVSSSYFALMLTCLSNF